MLIADVACSFVVTIAIIVIVIVVYYKCAKTASKMIVQDFRPLAFTALPPPILSPPITPPPPRSPLPKSKPIQQPKERANVPEAAATPMEKFIQKIESEKPVRYTVEDHINLVRLFGFCHDRNMSALVYEYMAKGSLDKYLFRESKAKAIKWEKLHEIAVGTAKGLAYLHEECQKRIIHYDIKPENILLDENFIPKVGDFGLAKLCNRESTHVTLAEKLWGTRGYSAPEIYYKNHPVTYKCDVYSFGMVLFEIISRRRNTIVHSSRDSIDFFPQRVWEEYEKGKLGSMALACGIERRQQEKVERMCMVALWCVQDLPEARPQMSDVVKILEGGMEILPPAEKPFQYLFPAARTAVLNPIPESSSDGGTREESQPRRYKERTTPIMAKYEIEMATSQQ